MGIRLPLLQPCVMNIDIPVLSQDLPVINIVIKQEEKPKPKLYKIVAGDNLTKIANAHQTSIERLWAANTQLADPNTIEVNQELKIPLNDEVLPERELPVTIEVPTVVSNLPRSSGAGFSSGWYTAGQCTAWVASQRYVPNGWGNATDWKWHAQTEGWTVSSVPIAGAIGWTYGHVVYVISVGDGVVTISEANYDWNGSVRTITVPTSKYTYLY